MSTVVRVKTEYRGLVGIRNIHYYDGRRNGLRITHDGKVMTLTPEDVKFKIVASKPVRDKFSSAIHTLLYYKWIPDDEKKDPEGIQPSLGI